MKKNYINPITESVAMSAHGVIMTSPLKPNNAPGGTEENSDPVFF